MLVIRECISMRSRHESLIIALDVRETDFAVGVGGAGSWAADFARAVVGGLLSLEEETLRADANDRLELVAAARRLLAIERAEFALSSALDLTDD
jgi:hypothetical protein